MSHDIAVVAGRAMVALVILLALSPVLHGAAARLGPPIAAPLLVADDCPDQAAEACPWLRTSRPAWGR